MNQVQRPGKILFYYFFNTMSILPACMSGTTYMPGAEEVRRY